ncbi:leucyl aminopeptidase [[Pasteurella] aerogenes]|nr:leucyl aminopeptidase [[Pasteurella] aerogenes]
MKYRVKNTALSQTTDCLVVSIFEDTGLSASGKKIDQLTQGYLSQLMHSGDLSGKFGQILCLHQLPNLAAKRLLLLGAGKAAEMTERRYKQLVQKMMQVVKDSPIREMHCFLTEIAIKNRENHWNIRFALEAIEENLYVFDQFKSEKSTVSSLSDVVFHVEDEQLVAAEIALQQASAVSLGVKSAKDLANCPPNVCNPAYLATFAQQLAQKSTFIQTQIVGEKEMAELGMNAYLAVSRGSHNEAQMSIIEYRHHPDPQAKPIVLVGKGLTFDAGGISLKPAESMDEMKYDMCGAASVYGVMCAIAELQLPLNVIGVLAGCENLPDGQAYRPGDILTTMKGLTVEVLNTDAEGRLVLCDALTYVERFDPELVIDVATLTGACVVALGQHNSGLVSTDDGLAQELLQAATQAGDKAWQLPLSEEYQEQLKSNFADLANIGGRWGGAITAGAFLANFTKNYRWAHLDIAGTAWLQGANKGATGRPVSLLTQFLINRAAL